MEATEKISKKTVLIPISVFYSLIYMSMGAFTSYIGLYYAGINLGNAQIGLLTSIGAAVTLFAQPFWGTVSDRAASKNRVLSLCLLLTASSIWLMPLSSRTVWLLALATAAFYFFQCAVNPMSDAMTLELSSKGHFSFSRIRTIGSLGYAIMAAIAGKVFDRSIDYIFPVFSILTLLAFSLSFSFPHVQGHQKGKNKVNLIALFKDHKLTLLYIYTFIIQSTMGFFYSFHAVYSKEVGISMQVIGIGIMIGSFSQFPFMIFFDKIYKRFGIMNILMLSGAVSALRWLLYATALNPVTVLFIWLLHGITFMGFYLCLAEYVSTNVIKELRTSGQMINSLIISGGSRILGGAVGGAVSAALGIRYTFGICSVICLAAFTGFFFTVKKIPAFREPERQLAGIQESSDNTESIEQLNS